MPKGVGKRYMLRTDVLDIYRALYAVKPNDVFRTWRTEKRDEGLVLYLKRMRDGLLVPVWHDQVRAPQKR